MLLFQIVPIAQQFFFDHYLVRGTPDYFFEEPERNNQARIMVSEIDLASYDVIVEEKYVFHVKVEHLTMCTCVDFVHAFAVMIALHCIFSVTYAKNIEVTMICVLRLLLETHDNQKIPPKVLSLISKIKKDMSKHQTLMFGNETPIRTSSVSVISSV